MSIKEIIGKIKVFLQNENLGEVITKEGVVVSFEGDEIEVGTELFIFDEAGERLPAPDGDHFLEDGTKIVVVEGKVSEIVAPEMPVEEAPEVEVETPEVPVEATEEQKQEVSMEDLLNKIKKLEQDNLELQEALSLLADNLSKVNFKREVKMSMVEKDEKPIVNNVENVRVGNKNPLNEVFKNMYK